MAEHKSRLVLEIDSRDAEQKAADVRKALGALEDAGVRVKPAMDKAGAGIDGVGKTASKAGESLGQLGKSADGSAKSTTSSSESYAEASARLLAMATNSLQASDYVKALSASTSAASVSFDAASDKVRSLSSLAARLRAESDALVGSTDKAAVSTRNASVATDLQAKELGELLGKINPAVAALGRLDDMQSKLGQFHKAGLLDTETFKDYSTRLDSTRQGLSAFDEGLSKTGISARQTEAALRQLPMQFTDIFTSLAAGQNPLLVLLQQGGQIKDSFGGIGNTVDVLGGKVKGFFSSVAGSSAGIAGAGAALGELASQQNAVAEGSEAAADGLGGMADSANTATDAAKNAKEAAAALGAGASGAGISMLAMVGAVTAAAAAIGLLIYAYNKGSKEADAYNNALILTGNYAGTTAADLGAMAKRVGSSTTTVADAAAALAMLAESAKIPVAQFEMISTTALQMEDATGKAIRETIAEFEKIADSPTKAIAALNEKYGFLTASVYEQVRALEQQGDKQAAAVIAEDAYSTALDTRSEKIKKNLGSIEKAWDDVTSSAKSAWDAIFDIGRQDVSGPDVTKIQQKINYLKSTLGSGYEDADAQAQIKALQAQIDAVNNINNAARERAAAEGEAVRVQREGLAAYEKFQQSIEARASKSQKRDKALKDAQDEINKSRLAGYKITNEQEAAALKAIRDNPSYKDAKTPATKPYTEDAGQKMLDQARQQFAVLQQQNSLIGLQKGEVDKLGASGQALIKWEQELADIKGKKTLTADQKSLIANQDLITAQLKRNAGLERENELRKTAAEEVAKLSAFQANQDSRLATAQDGLDANIAGIGLGDKARARLKEDLAIQKDYARQSAALLEQFNTKRISPDLYAKENAIVQEGLAKRLLMQQDNYNQQDAAQNNWLAGASSAWQNYFDIATDYNQQTQDATAQMLGSTTTSISDQIQGLIKGTTSLGDAFVNLGSTMGSSVLQALSDITAKWVVVHALKMAGITAETSAVVTSEGIKTTAKLATDAASTSSTLAAIATTLAANVSAAATTIASWLPAALVASIGSFGAAAVVGGTALIAAYAMIKGFSSGGYTGAGGVNEPAGMVHKGEVVWSQADISRFGGVAAVESLRKGNVTPIGAARTGSSSSGAQSSGSGGSSGMNVSVHNYAGAQVETQRDGDQMKIIIKQAKREIARDLAQGNGEVTRALTSGYGLKRAAR
ncbi:phage tail length tape measure family protein [Pseudomonas paraversuta]|uniref:phage tail length tape measure family protein n=1 Tax=Pseudomonas paraversuta TaxID=2750624 RepID=UPI001921FDA8|nr:phage tail length tape measure family protein [Pseudomonas paraversuta]